MIPPRRFTTTEQVGPFAVSVGVKPRLEALAYSGSTEYRI